jgi:tetratricopeptide (TPR) repeat protein
VTDETLTRRVQAARRAAAPALWHALVADLEAARAQNPAQAPALAALAVSYMALFDAGITPAGAASRDLYDRATAAADAALALDDHLADAHVVIGCYNYTYRWDAVTADRALRRALALAPDSGLARSRYGLCLALRGQFAAAVPQAERAVQLEPDVPELVVFLGRVNYLAGRADEAVACYEQALALAPELTATQFHLGLAYLQQGRFDEAIWQLEERVYNSARRTGAVASLGQAYAAAGRTADARALQAELVSRAARGEAVPAYQMAVLCAMLDEPDQAFGWLEQEFERPTMWGPCLGVDPRVAGLRTDPRFAAILARVGFAPTAPRART